MSFNRYNLAELRDGVKPFRLHFFPTLRSTNDHATELRRRGALYAPAVVLTARQTAGRGRRTNRWWSGAGGVTVTFVLPVEDHVAPHQLPLTAGLAVRDACAELTGCAQVQLKWPNDVLFEDRKLAGLLCERVHNADLVGIGLNVNLPEERVPADLRDKVTSLDRIAGAPVDITRAVCTLAQHIHRTVARRGDRSFADLLLDYDAHHALRGRQVTITTGHPDDPPITGTCEGLDDTGQLKVRTRSGLKHVIAGHVVAR